MKSKAILVFLIAILTVMTATMLVSAADPLSMSITTTVNGVDLDVGSPHLSNAVGETIPIKVVLTADQNVTDAIVNVRILGENVEAETGKFDMIEDRTYSKLLSLKVPSSIKLSPSDEFRLKVSVESREGDVEKEYDLTIQRESYNIEILSADVAKTATAGSVLNVDVVLKNRGSHESEDTFVIVRIPALDIEKKVYFSDLTPTDNCDDCDKQDAAEGIVSLKIPSDVKAGVYDIEVEAFNEDSSTKITKRLAISGLEQGSDILAAVTTKDIASGATATYDLILVNSGNRIAVYEIIPESAQNLIITVDEPIVTVPADSSRVVKVNVKAGNVMGTFNFAVNVNSQGQLVKRANLVANVVKSAITASNNVIILTVVLAIIFIVLLVVLIVLLTRKPAKSEEFEESYY